MEKLRILGKVISQPVVLNLQDEFTVFILVETEDHVKEYFYSYPKQEYDIAGTHLTLSPLTCIALTPIGDSIVIDVVLYEDGVTYNEIKNFYNKTRSKGFVDNLKLFEELGGYNFNH